VSERVKKMKKKYIHSKGLKETKSRSKLPANGQTQTVAVIAPPMLKTPKYRVEREVVTEILPKPSAEIPVEPETLTDVVSDKFWRIGVWSVMSVAVVLRFLWLALKPFHHDEGVNGLFMLTLFRDGVYKYDPSNYHGPSLYYFALFSTYIFGLNDFAVRLVTVVFGVLTVALIFSLRRYLGTIGTLFAASLVALSPGLTYFSRYFIHEILLVFFTLAVVICILKFWENARPEKFSIGAMSIVLFVCLLPIALQTASALSGENQLSQYVMRFVMIVLSIAVVYLAMLKLLKWDEGRPIYLLLASASAVMTFATKETSFIALGTMLIALGCLAFWLKMSADKTNGVKKRRNALLALFSGLLLLIVYFNADVFAGIGWFYSTYFVNANRKEQPLILLAVIALLIASVEVWRRYFKETRQNIASEASFEEPHKLSYQTFAVRLRNSPNSSALIFLGAVLFAYLGIVFFSSFFTYEKGIGAAFEAYNIWTKTGTKDHAQNGTWAYLKWLLVMESPLLIIGALGSLMAFWKARHRLAMFCALWAFGLFAAYTIIPYKTPWIAINFALPMALIAGYAINELANGKIKWQRTAAKLLAGLAIAICAYQTVELNFFRYDDEQRPYVYVHSLRSMSEMVAEIEQVSERAGTRKETTIVITSPDYFPLPWTLHDYKKVGFYGAMTKVPTAEIIVGGAKQLNELERDYAATHQFTGTYTLRPGVDLLLYIRKDLAVD
jgi:predicted membrane-bound mannosyltransferase